MAILGTAAATLLGIALSVGIASAPAAGAMLPDSSAVITRTLVGAQPLSQISEDAEKTLTQAKAAVASAETLGKNVAASGLDVGAVRSVPTSDLNKDVDALTNRETMPLLLVGILADKADSETKKVVEGTEGLQRALTAAQEKKAAEDAARVAAEQAAAEQAAAEQAAATLAAGNTVDGAKATARALMSSQYGWGGDQFSCLESLWTKESGWNYQAYNASGGATGIPQALPGSKMASAGSDWQTNAATQVAWGLDYISRAYGAPCSAWSHSQAMNWY